MDPLPWICYHGSVTMDLTMVPVTMEPFHGVRYHSGVTIVPLPRSRYHGARYHSGVTIVALPRSRYHGAVTMVMYLP